jgi:SAM-dependent methyltransferase
VGRFETVVDFYRYREPYPPEFFSTVAARLSLTQQMTMLDVGCGPGNLAIGFAPFIKDCTAIDPELQMLRVAREAAAIATAKITFLEKAIEDLDLSDGPFDFVTIGRALHWFARESTLSVLERVVSPGGRIAICGSVPNDSPVNAWNTDYKKVRKAWSTDPDESRYRIDLDQWFAGSRFQRLSEIELLHRHLVEIGDLVSRALSFSTTSPAVLGERRPQFEAAVESALTPFATAGALEEELRVKATIFSRRSA